MKLEMVRTLKSLKNNFEEYQRCAKMPYTRVTPSLVQDWYYAPALEMVGASRFIGYEGMTCELYNSDHIEMDGGETERYLQTKGWFVPLEENDATYDTAVELAKSLGKNGKIARLARFNVLKERYNLQIRDC